MRVIALLAWAAMLSAYEPAVDEFYVAHAEHQAAEFARKLDADPSLRIYVDIVEAPLDERDRRMAWVVRGGNFYGCEVKIVRPYIARPDVIAHEVCHCVNDYPYLTPIGYKVDVGPTARTRMEKTAKDCEHTLTGVK